MARPPRPMEVRFLAPATASSRARSASPRYMLAKVGSAQAKMPSTNGIGARQAGRHHPGDVRIGDDRSLDDRVVAAGRPHAEGVPGLDDAVAVGVPGQEGVDDLGVRRVARVHGVDTETGPHRGQRSEDLVGVNLVAAVHPFGPGGGEQTGKSLPASP